MDVSAPPGGVPWIPAKRSLTIIDDGLASEWVGRVWCNPPYSNVTPWAKKLIKHDNGIALVPMAKSGWFNLIWEHASGALPLQANLKFVRSDQTSGSIMLPVMLFAFGEANRQVLSDSGLGKVRWWCLWITCGQHAEPPFDLSTFLQCIWHVRYAGFA